MTKIFRMDVQRRDTVDYDAVSAQVRGFCAERLFELEKTLRPLVDGTFGDVLPGHLGGYLAAVKLLGQLYGATKEPRDLDKTLPMAKVQELIARIQAEHELQIAAAVAEAENRVRAELALGSKRSISAARAAVSGRLDDLERRTSS